MCDMMRFQIFLDDCLSSVEINYQGSASWGCERFCTLCDAVPHDFYIIVPIGSRLLVPETKSVEELVFDGGDAVTVSPDGQPLLPDMPVSHRGETANVDGKKSTFILLETE